MSRLLPQKEFFAILERERVRSDRTGREFSIIIFEAETTKDFESLIQYLTYIISQRVRCYDETGWVDGQRLGVLLPDTPAEGAQKLADDVCRAIIPKALRPKYTVFTYPSNWISGLGNDSNSQSNVSSRRLSGTTPEDKKSFLKMLKPLLPRRVPVWKRAMDICISILGLVIIAPFILLLTLYIKIVSKGPVYFKQRRVGYLGETFNCWKFRTMRFDAASVSHQNHMSELINNGCPMNKLDNEDPRIIPLGKFIRKSGLDELPQLINVIRGEMSLIGPRPCIPYEAQQFHSWHHKRFDVVPGLTGLWQVNGKNRTTFNEMIRLDIHYAQKRSLWLDLKILFKTAPAIIDQVNH